MSAEVNNPAVDSWEQVAEAAGIFDMPGIPAGSVMFNMTQLLQVVV